MTRPRSAGGQIHKYLLSALLSIAAIVAVVFVSGAFIGSDFKDADIKNDWVVASALLDGVNPYGDLDVLAAHYADGQYTPPTPDTDYEGPNRTPRTPGAIVLGALWVPIPLANLVEVNNLIGALLLVPIIFLVIWSNHNPGWQVVSIVILFSTAMLWSIRFSTVTPLVALATTYAIIGIRDGDKPSSGVAIAVSISTKAFPVVLLVLAMAYKRWRTFAWAIGSLAALNLTPLLMRNVRFEEAIDALLGASARYSYLGGNMSLGRSISDIFGPVWEVAVLVLAITSLSWWIISKPTDVETDSALLVGTAILLTPLSWPHYALVFYPVALMFILSASTSPRIKAVAATSLLLAFPSGDPLPGAMGILILTLLAAITRINRLGRPWRLLSAPASAR